MPKISKVTLSFHGKSQEFEMYYNREDGFYLKDFPKSWTDTVNATDTRNKSSYKTSGHATEATLLKDAKIIIERYLDITAVTKKIIIIIPAYGKRIQMQRTKLGHYSSPNSNVGNIKDGSESLDIDWAVGFEWKVCVMTSGAKRMSYEVILDAEYNEVEREVYPEELNAYNNSIVILDWTPERHEFFLDMERRMEKLAKGLNEFFGNEKKMLAIIDSGGTKLLGNG